MDGVLIDSEPLHNQAWIETLNSLGISTKSLPEYPGVAEIEVAKKFINEYNIKMPEIKLVDKKHNYLMDMLDTHQISPYPGVISGLGSISELRIGLATSSNRHFTSRILNKLALDKFFMTVTTSDEIDKPKPYPEIYLKTACYMSLSPVNCIAVEDSYSGVKAAKAAGMFVIGVNRLGDEIAEADIINETTEQAIRWIKTNAKFMKT